MKNSDSLLKLGILFIQLFGFPIECILSPDADIRQADLSDDCSGNFFQVFAQFSVLHHKILPPVMQQFLSLQNSHVWVSQNVWAIAQYVLNYATKDCLPHSPCVLFS